MIAAAGTGGHVFPGLAVGEALVSGGVAREDIVYVGGDRLEAEVYPREGFPFLQVSLAGLKRSLTIDNARIPAVVMRAKTAISEAIASRDVQVVLGMGGYVTIPTGLAARKNRVVFFIAEQNAQAGLANRASARWARASFMSFPETGGLPGGQWVGNPVRREFWSFDRESLRSVALEHYELEDEGPVVGVFGGSLGAGAINDAVVSVVGEWAGPSTSFVHLTGDAHLDSIRDMPSPRDVVWRRLAFEDRMDLFYAASDLVVARAGGAVAELTATATPSILIPGSFGSGGHQEGNARVLAEAGAARIVSENDVATLGSEISEVISDTAVLESMALATLSLAKPGAALTIAGRMMEAVA